MQQKRRSPGFTLAILCTFTLLLAACQAGTSSERQTLHQNTTRLNLRETPGMLDTMTPGTMTPGANKPAEYVAQVPAENAWVGLSSTGKRIVAFVTDGSQGHQPTFAQWFKGPVTNGVVDTTTPAKNGTDHLQATLNGNTATGTITLAGGKSIAFTADAVAPSEQTAGLYRSEREIKNQRYVAGWIVLPAGAGTATPQATGTTTPSATATGTPSATATTTPSAMETGTPSTATTTPSATETGTPSTATTTPSATETGTPSATATTTPSATATGSPSTTGALPQGGAILNEQNFTVLPTQPLTQNQINSKEVAIPNLGAFKLVPCGKNQC